MCASFILHSSFCLRSAPVAQLSERDASNVGDEGESPSGSANSCRVSPTTRGAPLRTDRLGVELPHAAPFAHVVQRRDGALKTRTVSVQVRPWAPPRVAQRRGVPLKTEKLQVQVLPRGPMSQSSSSSFSSSNSGLSIARTRRRTIPMECQPDKRAGPVC